MRHYNIILSGWQVDNVSEFTRDIIVHAIKAKAERWNLVDAGDGKYIIPAHVVGIEEFN
jgi:hypothetical protein